MIFSNKFEGQQHHLSANTLLITHETLDRLFKQEGTRIHLRKTNLLISAKLMAYYLLQIPIQSIAISPLIRLDERKISSHR
jgi:hypothetical protein